MASLAIAGQASSRLTPNVFRFVGAVAFYSNTPRAFREVTGLFGVKADLKAARTFLLDRGEKVDEHVRGLLATAKALKGTGGAGQAPRHITLVDNLNKAFAGPKHRSATTADNLAASLTQQTFAAFDSAGNLEDLGLPCDIGRYIIVGRGHPFHGQAFNRLGGPCGTRLPGNMVPPSVSKGLSRTMSAALADSFEAGLLAPGATIPGVGDVPDLEVTDDGQHPWTGGEVRVGSDPAHPGISLMAIEIFTPMHAIRTVPDIVDASEWVLCACRDMSERALAEECLARAHSRKVQDSVEMHNAGSFAKLGPRFKGDPRTGTALHKETYGDHAYDEDGVRKVHIALPRVILDEDEGSARGTLHVVEQVAIGPAENAVSTYAAAGSDALSDEGLPADAGDMLTHVNRQALIGDMAAALESGAADPAEVKQLVDLATITVNHSPIVGGLHELMNLLDAENHGPKDAAAHATEATFIHSTHQNLKKPGDNFQGKQQLMRRAAAAKYKLLVGDFHDRCPDHPQNPGDADGVVTVHAGRGDTKIPDIEVTTGEVAHPGGRHTPAGADAVAAGSSEPALRSAVVEGWNVKGARLNSADGESYAAGSVDRRAGLRAALSAAHDGTGPALHVRLRRPLQPGEPPDEPFQDRQAALVERWAEYNRGWLAMFRADVRRQVAISKSMHPGQCAVSGGGCEFARWSTQLIERAAMSDAFQQAASACDADAIRAVQKIATLLDSLTGKDKYSGHNRLECGRRMFRSLQFNVWRDMHMTTPMTRGGTLVFWDHVNEHYIHVHKTALNTSEASNRLLNTLTVISLNVDLFRDIGVIVSSLLGVANPGSEAGATAGRGSDNSGVGTSMRGDIAQLDKLYLRARAGAVSPCGAGVDDIDMLRVAATALPIPLSGPGATAVMDANIMCQVAGLVGPYTFSDFEQGGPGAGLQRQLLCAEVRMSGDKDPRLYHPAPAPGWGYDRPLCFGGGAGPSADLDRFKKRTDGDHRLVEVPVRTSGDWKETDWVDVDTARGVVAYEENTGGVFMDEGVRNATVVGSVLSGSPSPQWQKDRVGPEGDRRLRPCRTIYAELSDNFAAVAASPDESLWCVVTVLANSGGRGGSKQSPRKVLGVPDGDIISATVYLWRDNEDIRPCSTDEAASIAARYRHGQTAARRRTAAAAAAANDGDDDDPDPADLDRAGAARARAAASRGMGAALAKVEAAQRLRGLGKSKTGESVVKPKKNTGGSCYATPMTPAAASASVAFEAVGSDLLSTSAGHRKWASTNAASGRLAFDKKLAHVLKVVAGVIPVETTTSETVDIAAATAASSTPEGARGDRGLSPDAADVDLSLQRAAIVAAAERLAAATRTRLATTKRFDAADRRRNLSERCRMSDVEVGAGTRAYVEALAAKDKAVQAEAQARAALAAAAAVA